MARLGPGCEGLVLAKGVSRTYTVDWDAGPWMLGEGYQSPSRLREGLGEGMSTSTSTETSPPSTPPASGRGDDRPHVVAIDYGAKDNIFRNLVKAGARVTVVPATASLDEVLGHQPDGVFLSKDRKSPRLNSSP